MLDPLIHLGEFETEQPLDSMAGKAFYFDPSMDQILANFKVDSHLFDTRPAFFSSYLEPLRGS